MIAKAAAILRPRLRTSRDELDWIRWGGKGRFIRECRAGDSVIQIWRSSRAHRPSSVIRAQPVLLKQKTKNWTRFYLPPGTGALAEIPWGKFQRLLKSLGYSRRVGPGIEHLLENDMADVLARNWNSSTKL